MFLTILTLCLLGSPRAQEAEAPVEAEVELLEEAEADEELLDEELEEEPAKRKVKRRRPTQLEAEERNDLPLWLALTALLGLLIVSRMQPYRKEAIRKGRTRADRPAPVSDVELGRYVFHAVIAADLDEYRALFLTGAEASQVLGPDQSAGYLEARSPQRLEDALVELAVQIPEDSHFVNAESAGGLLSVVIANAQGTEKTVLVGSEVTLGATHRLVYPATQLEQRAAE